MMTYWTKFLLGLSLSYLCTATLAAEPAITRGMDCYTIGYRYAKCALSTTVGLKCPASWDFSVPPRCRNTKESDRGIKEGTEDFYATMKEYGLIK